MNSFETEKLVESVAVTVKVNRVGVAEAVVGVPLMTPALKVRPAGKAAPVRLHVLAPTPPALAKLKV